MIPCATFSGILIIIWQRCTSIGALIVFCILFGFCSGAFVSLPPAVVAAISRDPRKIGIRVGQSFTIVSFGALTGPSISGAIQQQQNGAFSGMAFFAGFIVLSGGIVLFVTRIIWSRKVLLKV